MVKTDPLCIIIKLETLLKAVRCYVYTIKVHTIFFNTENASHNDCTSNVDI